MRVRMGLKWEDGGLLEEVVEEKEEVGRKVVRRWVTGALADGTCLLVTDSLGMKTRTETRINPSLKVPRTYPLADPLLLKIRHHLCEPRLRDLLGHGFAFDGLDLGHGGGAEVFGCGGESVDVLEDVHGFGDGEGFSVGGCLLVGYGIGEEKEQRRGDVPHLGEHVVLRLAAWRSIRVC